MFPSCVSVNCFRQRKTDYLLEGAGSVGAGKRCLSAVFLTKMCLISRSLCVFICYSSICFFYMKDDVYTCYKLNESFNLCTFILINESQRCLNVIDVCSPVINKIFLVYVLHYRSLRIFNQGRVEAGQASG